MVMHARKPQRMNDGYFEKHQTHPYQNSKYSSSKGSYGGGGERYERIRDSPNGNSYRSDSPDSASPRERLGPDRSYQSKSSYLQKIREKERETRDYKLGREASRGGVYASSECRSPKDKRSKDSEHRTNHDRERERDRGSMEEKLALHPSGLKHSSSSSGSQRSAQQDRKPLHNSCQDKREERSERVTRVGDWSEHISSSGKKYYYNCKTEVSQWEKPREWVERERERERESRFRSKEVSGGGDSHRPYARSHDKHSSSGNARGTGPIPRANVEKPVRHWTNSRDNESNQTQTHESHDPRRKHVTDGELQSTQQDMDISPGDSTPTSELSYNQHTPSTSGGLGRMLGAVDQTTVPQSGLTPLDNDGANTQGPVLLGQALPRLTSQQPDPQPSPGVMQNTPAMVPPPSTAGATANTPGPPVSVTLTTLPRILSVMSGSGSMSCGVSTANVGKETSTAGDKTLLMRQPTPGQALSDAGSTDGGPTEGPPTPTHSESQDCLDARKSLTSVTSPPASLSSLQGVAALRSTGPTITPSLSNYYRDDLVNHVRGWPADILEKQAQKLCEEAHVMGSLQCTKVSAELKSARSIVRLTEIQATLQEQRILFLRQQIQLLEDMKAQNSFMSDDV